MERVPSTSQALPEGAADAVDGESAPSGKLTSSKIAQRRGWKTVQLLERATTTGYLALDGDRHVLTAMGAQAGLEFVPKSRFGPYFLWPEDISLD